MKRIIITILSILPFVGFAQPDTGKLETDVLEVTNNFDAILAETKRIEILPALPRIVEGDKNLIYTIPSKKITLDYLAPKLRPLGAKKEEIEKGYNGYAKLGYGFPNSPYGEIGYQYSYEDKFRIGGQIGHHSANNKNRENQRFSTTGGKLEGAYFLDNDHTIDANLGYVNDKVYFYGYNPEVVSFTKSQVEQSFADFNFGAKFSNTNESRQNLNYSAGFNFYNYTDNFAAKENSFDMRLKGTKWFAEKHPLNVTLRTDFSSYTDGTSQSLNNFFLQPNFTYHANRFKVKVGVNLASSDDNFLLFPDAEATFNLLGNSIAIFAGANGDLYKNNLRSISQYNPFISTTGSLQVMNSAFRYYYGGLKGSVRTFNYQAEMGYKEVSNLALFIIDPSDSTRFQTLYDSAEIFVLKGTLGAKITDNFDATLTIAQNLYSTQVQDEAFGLPNFEASLGLRYKLMDKKLIAKADLFSQSGNWFRDEDTLTDRLSGVFDISLGAEYFFMKNIGVFAQVNNILGDKRQRWFRYPTYGINVLGGITARF